MGRGRPKGSKNKLKAKFPVENIKDLSHPEIDDISLKDENCKRETIKQEKKDKQTQDRKQKLDNILRDINKKIPNAVKYASSLENRERLSFGYDCLDKLT